MDGAVEQEHEARRYEKLTLKARSTADMADVIRKYENEGYLFEYARYKHELPSHIQIIMQRPIR